MPHPVGVPLRYRGGEQAFRCWSGRTVRRERWPAAQDAVFRRLLPMARAVAAGAVPAGGPVDPGAGERAAESGLARAVARWWSADGAGFEVFASITIAVELDRLSATASDRGPVTAVADRYDEPLTGHPRE